jgi:hypothetical protein
MLGLTAALLTSLAAQIPDQPPGGPGDQVPADPAPLLAHFEPQRPALVIVNQASPSDWFGPIANRWELQDTVRRRRGAHTVSDGYATRLKIHQIGAIAMLPLVATEFVLGQSMINDENRSSGVRTAHKITALTIGTVAGVNTITGALNWWETRKNPDGRTRRTVHALLMLAADAGFVWTASAAGNAKNDIGGARHHRALAEASISLTVLSSVMMWLWKG